jgi:hypothetical protein
MTGSVGDRASREVRSFNEEPPAKRLKNRVLNPAPGHSPLIPRVPDAILSMTESLCSGERWLYRADIVIVL